MLVFEAASTKLLRAALEGVGKPVPKRKAAGTRQGMEIVRIAGTVDVGMVIESDIGIDIDMSMDAWAKALGTRPATARRVIWLRMVVRRMCSD